MQENQNPLLGYFRKPEVYVTLPSRGKYYAEGSIDMPPTNEIGVFPMTAKDELLFKTPDALLNGSSTAEVVKSCIPAIKDPWAIPSLDMDVLLIAIRIATYGNQMDINTTCPKCGTQTEYGVDLGNLLEQANTWAFVNHNEINGLKFEYQPLSYKEMNVENLRQFEENKIMRIVNDENTSDEQKTTLFSEAFLKLTAHTVDLICKTICKITLPDGTVVENVAYIKEFIQNTGRDTFSAVQEHLEKQRDENSFKEFELTCENEECKESYKTPIVFDNSNFFA